tara:strand:- start:941 stop:1420 length:480 start_codon:yes stop_codon:yes gene_type:complete
MKTQILTVNKIHQICKLKKQHYGFSIQKQKNWFKRNIKENYIHNMIYLKEDLIGYNCLRTHYIKKKIKYILFDTIIIDKKFRKLGHSKKIMKYSIKIIKRFKTVGILFCKNKMKNYYLKYEWKVLKNDNFLKSKKICMTYDLDKISIEKFKNNFLLLIK